MNDDIFKSVSQGSDGAYDEENRRIHEIADKLRRRCQLYEAQLRDGQGDVNPLEVEQRVTEQYAKDNDTYMAALGFTKINNEGRYVNSDYEVWDIVPRNVLRDKDGDMYVIDAEIAKK